MNAKRRKAISELLSRLDSLKNELEILRDEEQEYFDNMPDSLQQGEKGDTAAEEVSSMDDAINSMDEACSSLEEMELI
jgi:hypothetical protein